MGCYYELHTSIIYTNTRAATEKKKVNVFISVNVVVVVDAAAAI